jgi:outer membrane receptor for ferrienterochelin and colicin
MYQSSWLQSSVTLFKSKWKDAINLVPISEPGFNNQYQNLGRNDSNGIEIAFSGESEGWRWNINGSYVDSKNIGDDFESGYGAFPKYILNTDIEYKLPETELSLFLANRVMLKMEEGPASGQISETRQLPNYHTSDVSLRWTRNHSQHYQFAVKNIFNRKNINPSIWNAENGNREKGIEVQLRIHQVF